MKIINFITTLPSLTYDFMEGFLKALKHIWTNEKVYWSFSQTYFTGNNEEELIQKRDEYVKECGKILETLKNK